MGRVPLRMVADKKSPNQNMIFLDFHAVSLPTPNSKQSSKPSKAPYFGLVNDVFHLKTGRAGARALQRGALEVLEALASLQKFLALALLWWIWIGTCHQGSKAPNGKKHQRHSAEDWYCKGFCECWKWLQKTELYKPQISSGKLNTLSTEGSFLIEHSSKGFFSWPRISSF